MAKPQTDLRPIVIKRIKKSAAAHHGGAWKIAYADFVTAMMAFFLLMWLLGSTTKGDLKGIADYFNTPLKVAMAGGDGSGDSSSIIKGGGRDLTRQAGQVKDGDVEAQKRSFNLQAARDEVRRREAGRLADLKVRVEGVLDARQALKPFRRQIRLDITSEGLRIQVVDEQGRPMFDNGSARLKDYTREILRSIAPVLNGVENRVALSGHTDATPFSSGERAYSNWELSADRANASRRELVAGGLDEGKIVRVVGLASSVLLDKADPHSPVNRRISVMVMTRQAEDALLQEKSAVEIQDAEQAAQAISGLPAPAAVPAAVPAR